MGSGWCSASAGGLGERAIGGGGAGETCAEGNEQVEASTSLAWSSSTASSYNKRKMSSRAKLGREVRLDKLAPWLALI